MISITEAIVTSLSLSGLGYNSTCKARTGDWTKPRGRSKRKRKQKMQKVSRRNNRK